MKIDGDDEEERRLNDMTTTKKKNDQDEDNERSSPSSSSQQFGLVDAMLRFGAAAFPSCYVSLRCRLRQTFDGLPVFPS